MKDQLTFLLPQPEVQYAVLPGDLYMFPRSDGILLGGTHENGAWSLVPDAAAKERILSRHKEFFDNFRRSGSGGADRIGRVDSFGSFPSGAVLSE